ncbi:MAG: hypothetical protein NVS4B8_27810 [Herpetosiphon sp.]
MHVSSERLNQIAILLQAVAFLLATPEVVGSENIDRAAPHVARSFAALQRLLGKVGMGGLTVGRFGIPLLVSSVLGLLSSGVYLNTHLPMMPAPAPVACVPRPLGSGLFPLTLPTMGGLVTGPLLLGTPVFPGLKEDQGPTGHAPSAAPGASFSTAAPPATSSADVLYCDSFDKIIQQSVDTLLQNEKARKRQAEADSLRYRVVLLALPLLIGLVSLSLALLTGRIVWLLEGNPHRIRRLTRLGALLFFCSLICQFGATLVAHPH